ncbi:hypothetical protein [Paraburkholderia sediminicola]|uniref:hypothetical protein n=1 Tax=Paraburkholderia sediminicola TaxID=458836 RepID=UPI0038BAC1D0
MPSKTAHDLEEARMARTKLLDLGNDTVKALGNDEDYLILMKDIGVLYAQAQKQFVPAAASNAATIAGMRVAAARAAQDEGPRADIQAWFLIQRAQLETVLGKYSTPT